MIQGTYEQMHPTGASLKATVVLLLIAISPACKWAVSAEIGVEEIVFADTSDPDYQKVLALCRRGKRRLEEIKRFDMPGFRPTPSYIREMERYGILPNDLPEGALIDVYATDRAYWRSQWWRPTISADTHLSMP